MLVDLPLARGTRVSITKNSARMMKRIMMLLLLVSAAAAAASPRPSLSVLDFGAKADGATNNQVAKSRCTVVLSSEVRETEW